MGQLGMSYSKSYNKVYKRAGHLFQGRYQLKMIDDDNYFVYLSRYIHLNPVTAGLVIKPQDWEYSSYREYIGLLPLNFIQPKYILDFFKEPSTSATKHTQKMYKKYIETEYIF
jgi:hypothetical protein